MDSRVRRMGGMAGAEETRIRSKISHRRVQVVIDVLGRRCIATGSLWDRTAFRSDDPVVESRVLAEQFGHEGVRERGIVAARERGLVQLSYISELTAHGPDIRTLFAQRSGNGCAGGSRLSFHSILPMHTPSARVTKRELPAALRLWLTASFMALVLPRLVSAPPFLLSFCHPLSLFPVPLSSASLSFCVPPSLPRLTAVLLCAMSCVCRPPLLALPRLHPLPLPSLPLRRLRASPRRDPCGRGGSHPPLLRQLSTMGAGRTCQEGGREGESGRGEGGG